MSLSREKRASVKHYILEKIADQDSNLISKTAEVFSISPNTIYRYLREMTADQILTRSGKRYSLVKSERSFRLFLRDIAPDTEDLVFERYLQPHISQFPDNIVHIWYYCFTEMINNVLDHSDAESVTIHIIQDYLNTSVIIDDDGIGIFERIRSYYGYSTLEDAILELFKGKLTTDKSHHSGEGIFFSSRIMDVFAAISGGKVFSHTEFSDLIEDLRSFPELESLKAYQTGTVILMKLSNFSKKKTKEIFDQYADVEGGFTRTIIPVKNVFPSYPVSRSQAKRLSHRLESFREVLLDFEGVQEIGQGFAHELFVVFQQQHPDVILIPFNTNADVQRMIHHVQA